MQLHVLSYALIEFSHLVNASKSNSLQPDAGTHPRKISGSRIFDDGTIADEVRMVSAFLDVLRIHFGTVASPLHIRSRSILWYRVD